MDLHKYDNIKLNPKQEINDKIKALFLLFDRDAMKHRLTHVGILRLMDFYINTLIKHEEFESVVAFKKRKADTIKKYKTDRRDYTPGLMFRFLRRKFRNFIVKKLKNIKPVWKLFRAKSN